MPRVLAVAGTRPEAIKLGPVLADLRRWGVPVEYLWTGQHDDEAMTRAAWSAAPPSCGWMEPGCTLAWTRGGLDPAEQAAANAPGIAAALRSQADPPGPSWRAPVVLVQGDTSSCLAGALAAKLLGWPLAHLEAGLRSYDDSMPEERARRRVDALADLLLAPSALAAATLTVEAGRGLVHGRVVDVGQTGLDALCEVGSSDEAAEAFTRELLPTVGGTPWVLMTLHRAALDYDHALRAVKAAATSCRDLGWTLVVAEHPRWNGALSATVQRTVEVVAPLSYRATAHAVLNAHRSSPRPSRLRAVLTDSGGLAEEAHHAGCPVACLRPTTERWELAALGVPFGDPSLRDLSRLAIDAALGQALAEGAGKGGGPEPGGDRAACKPYASPLPGGDPCARGDLRPSALAASAVLALAGSR